MGVRAMAQTKNVTAVGLGCGPIEAAMPFVVSPYRNDIFHWLAVCKFFVQVTKAFGKQWKAWPLLLVNILNAASLARIQSTYDGPQKTHSPPACSS